eukprot:1066222-Rhodomonas_salina.3
MQYPQAPNSPLPISASMLKWIWGPAKVKRKSQQGEPVPLWAWALLAGLPPFMKTVVPCFLKVMPSAQVWSLLGWGCGSQSWTTNGARSAPTICLPQGGASPLHVASTAGKVDSVRILLESGADAKVAPFAFAMRSPVLTHSFHWCAS